MKKEKIKNILLIVIVALVTSFVTAYGVSSTFDSSNVCYKVDSNTGASVQDTIDDLYGRASDYSELKSYFKNNPTSYFIGSDLRLGYNNKNSNGTGLILYGNDNARGSRFMYDASNGITSIDAYNSSGTAGQGTLNLRGNPVQINGVDVTPSDVIITPYSGGSIVHFSGKKIGKIVFGTLEIKVGSASITNWTNIAAISALPNDSVTVPAVRTGNGSFTGMVQIYTNGAIQLYSTQTLSNNNISFTFNYFTN